MPSMTHLMWKLRQDLGDSGLTLESLYSLYFLYQEMQQGGFTTQEREKNRKTDEKQ